MPNGDDNDGLLNTTTTTIAMTTTTMVMMMMKRQRKLTRNIEQKFPLSGMDRADSENANWMETSACFVQIGGETRAK